ncbi:putative Ig domain-containing protein [Gemmatimonadota bacterium]
MYFLDTQEYRDADLDDDGLLCGMGFTPVLAVTTSALPDGQVGTSYSESLAAFGGDGNYTWSVSVGTLPDGLSLTESSGLISGTPTAPGTWSFTVQLVSGEGQMATADLSIKVDELDTFDCSMQSEIPQTECQALVALYESTNGAGWTNSTGWLESLTPCGWSGVRCDAGSVTRVDRAGNQLTGSIPAELRNLSNLTSLGLDNNQLTGPIPSELGMLENLTDLDLSENQLTGPIPDELGNLSALSDLLLYDNRLSGPIPASLNNLPKLWRMYLYLNQLSGSIPAELGNLSYLLLLDLSRNQLTGPIPPELGNLSRVWVLDLYHNQLTGPIPAELGNMSNVRALNLYENQLTGPLPAELENLPHLGGLYLWENQLTGSIPAEWGNLSELVDLRLENNQLTGSIPAELGSLSKLGILHLYSNQLTGPIPAEIGNLSELFRFRLDDNQLSDLVPLQVAQLGGLLQGSRDSWRCQFRGNAGLHMLDTQEYHDADLDDDGYICEVALSAVLTVTTPSLPDGQVGTSYSESLAATGGDGDYTWSISSGTLPGGLSLASSTGVISGTPTTAGTSNFTVQVASGEGQTATKALSIQIS